MYDFPYWIVPLGIMIISLPFIINIIRIYNKQQLEKQLEHKKWYDERHPWIPDYFLAFDNDNPNGHCGGPDTFRKGSEAWYEQEQEQQKKRISQLGSSESLK